MMFLVVWCPTVQPFNDCLGNASRWPSFCLGKSWLVTKIHSDGGWFTWTLRFLIQASSCLRWECWAFEEGGQTLCSCFVGGSTLVYTLLKSWGNLEHVVYWNMQNTQTNSFCFTCLHVWIKRWNMLKFSVLIHVCILPSNISGWIMTSSVSVEADFLPNIRWTEWLRCAKQME